MILPGRLIGGRESGLVPADRPAGLQVCQLGQPPFDDEVVQRAAVVEEFQAVSPLPRAMPSLVCAISIVCSVSGRSPGPTTRSGSLGQVSPRQATMPSGRTSAKAFLYVSRARSEAIHSTSMGIRRLPERLKQCAAVWGGREVQQREAPRGRGRAPSVRRARRRVGRGVRAAPSVRTSRGRRGGSGVLSEMTSDDSG